MVGVFVGMLTIPVAEGDIGWGMTGACLLQDVRIIESTSNRE
jgi:hypothetical protein